MLREYKCSFKRKRSSIDHVLSLDKHSLYELLIDTAKVYDSKW